MLLFEYLYYRMFKAYADKNESPYLRTFLYIATVKFIIAVVLFVYLQGMFKVANILSNGIPTFYLYLAIIIILGSTYWLYSQKDFGYYQRKFDSFTRANQFVKIWMLIILPFIFLFGSIHLYVVLFGGHIMGETVTGLLNK